MNDSIGHLNIIGEDGLITWDGLFDRYAMKAAGRSVPSAADFINDATVTWVFRAAAADGSFDAAGALVSNAGGTMAYVTGSNGCYIGTIEDNAAFTNGATYWAIASFTATGDKVGERKIRYVAGYHGSN